MAGRTIQLAKLDVALVGEEDVGRQAHELHPFQFLSRCGQRADPCFLRALRQCLLVATEASGEGGERGLRLILCAGMAIGATHTDLDVLGVIKSDGLWAQGTRIVWRKKKEAEQDEKHKAQQEGATG